MKVFLFGIIYIICFITLTAQTKTVTINGLVRNAENKEALPYANLITVPSNTGTTTDYSGNFNLSINASQLKDTVYVSFIGFEIQKFPVQDLKQNMNIDLIPITETLDEFVLTPLTPHEFMKNVARQLQQNTPNEPFSTLGYYTDLAKENDGFLGENHAVIKSYFPNLLDTTVKNQHQVVLYEERTELDDLVFMAKKRKKEEAKAKERRAENGEDSTDFNIINPREMFGGLNEVVKQLSLNGDELFLDTNNFNKYDFQFNPTPIYTTEGNEITLIHAKTKRRQDGFKANGKIYVDRNSMSIIKMEFRGDIRIPIYLKPILLLAGIGIQNPKLHYARNFEKMNDAWYPKNVFYTINLGLTEKKLFKKNTHSNFTIQQSFHIQKYNLEQPKNIAKSKRYSDEKTIADQVFPDPNITWDMIKRVKF
ncbi:MAG: carboxypeptidase-like regulatory domain-containing protein [Flavobacteriales bacterium]